MKLYEAWEALASQERSEKEHQDFWQAYLIKEQKNYEKMLGEKNHRLEGTIEALAAANDMDPVTFTGFLDGINTSLVEAVDLEALEESTEIHAEVDFEKLYFNMLDFKADWLYQLPAWDNLLTLERRNEIKKAYNKSKTVVKDVKVGRNDPCPCGSGKKYKKCCGA